MNRDIDWWALVLGSSASFIFFIGFSWISGKLNFPPQQRSLHEPFVLYTDPAMLFFIVAAMPGAIIAAYLHTTNVLSGVVYGIAVNLLGIVLPLIATLIVFFGLFGILAGSLDVFRLLYVILLIAIPLYGVIVTVGGASGGVLGAVLKKHRTG